MGFSVDKKLYAHGPVARVVRDARALFACIFLSLALSVAALWIVALKLARGRVVAVLAIVALTLSKAFVDKLVPHRSFTRVRIFPRPREKNADIYPVLDSVVLSR